MNKKEFMDNLKRELKGIKKDELEDIIDDYEEHFEEAKKRGETEEEVSKELGTPKDIAKELNAYAVLEKAENNFSFENAMKVIAAFFSLGLFNLLFIPPYLFVVMCLVGMGFLSIGIVFGGVGGFALLILAAITGIDAISITDNVSMIFLGSFLAIGGGVLLGILDFFAIRSFYKFTIKYIKMNISLIKDKD